MNMQMNPQSHFESADLYLCAFLVSQGARLDGTTRDPRERVFFSLRREEGMDELLQQYWSNQPLLLTPSQLFSALKHLKSLIHSQR